MRKVVISIVNEQMDRAINRLIVSEDNLSVVLHALVNNYDLCGDIEIVEPMIVPE